jgi:hypothetical protein
VSRTKKGAKRAGYLNVLVGAEKKDDRRLDPERMTNKRGVVMVCTMTMTSGKGGEWAMGRITYG